MSEEAVVMFPRIIREFDDESCDEPMVYEGRR